MPDIPSFLPAALATDSNHLLMHVTSHLLYQASRDWPSWNLYGLWNTAQKCRGEETPQKLSSVPKHEQRWRSVRHHTPGRGPGI